MAIGIRRTANVWLSSPIMEDVAAHVGGSLVQQICTAVSCPIANLAEYIDRPLVQQICTAVSCPIDEKEDIWPVNYRDVIYSPITRRVRHMVNIAWPILFLRADAFTRKREDQVTRR